MEAAYDVLLLLGALFAVALILFAAWWIGVDAPRRVAARRREVERLRGRIALLERRVPEQLDGARVALRDAAARLAAARAADR